MSSAPTEADRSIPELLRRLAAETSLLVRQEVELARAEVLRTLRQSLRPAMSFAVAVLFALGAFGALTALLIIAIGLVLPLWASAIIVTALYGCIAAIAVARGRSDLRLVETPLPQTAQTVKEDIAAVRSGVERGRG